MRIAITDANIFIDLLFMGQHGNLFEVDLEIHTTRFVFDELNERQQEALSGYVERGQLIIETEAEPEPVESIQKRKSLSESDKSALHLALRLKAILLTGDDLLRKVSGFEKIEVHGILWLLDKFIDAGVLKRKDACKCLEKLMEYNKRLPADECEKRLKRWRRS